MYWYESWTIMKTEHQRIDAFELWCWRRLLRVPWTARSNQSILKETNPEYSLKELMLKLKLPQYFGHLMWRTNSLEKTLMLGKIEGRRGDRGWDGLMVSLTQWTSVWANSGREWRTRKPGVLQSMWLQRVDSTWWLNNNNSWSLLNFPLDHFFTLPLLCPVMLMCVCVCVCVCVGSGDGLIPARCISHLPCRLGFS